MNRPRATDGLPPHVADLVTDAARAGVQITVVRAGAHPPALVIFSRVAPGSETELRLCGLPDARAAREPGHWYWRAESN